MCTIELLPRPSHLSLTLSAAPHLSVSLIIPLPLVSPSCILTTIPPPIIINQRLTPSAAFPIIISISCNQQPHHRQLPRTSHDHHLNTLVVIVIQIVFILVYFFCFGMNYLDNYCALICNICEKFLGTSIIYVKPC